MKAQDTLSSEQLQFTAAKLANYISTMVDTLPVSLLYLLGTNMVPNEYLQNETKLDTPFSFIAKMSKDCIFL